MDIFVNSEAEHLFTAFGSYMHTHGDKLPTANTALSDPRISAALAKYRHNSKKHLHNTGHTAYQARQGASSIQDADKKLHKRVGEISTQKPALTRQAPTMSSRTPTFTPPPTPVGEPPNTGVTQTSTPTSGIDRNKLNQVISLLEKYDTSSPRTFQDNRDTPPTDHARHDPLDHVDLRDPGCGTLTKEDFYHYGVEAARRLHFDEHIIPRIGEMVSFMADHESSCNPAAVCVNPADPNTHGEIQSDGAPLFSTRGAMQMMIENFKRHHRSGTSDCIYDPEANVTAALGMMLDKGRINLDGSGVEEFFNARRANGYTGWG